VKTLTHKRLRHQWKQHQQLMKQNDLQHTVARHNTHGLPWIFRRGCRASASESQGTYPTRVRDLELL